MSSDRRIAISIRGLVQGVGFRPFVVRLAAEHRLRGWVRNTPSGVEIEAEGAPIQLRGFRARLVSDAPVHARIDQLVEEHFDVTGYEMFSIRPSPDQGAAQAWLSPDIAACPACLSEVLDPTNRRYRYPFTTCTNCGPRYTMISALPYDRANTSMAGFAMCAACRAEYEDPANRRFHSQTNACADCGPQIHFADRAGSVCATRHGALLMAVSRLRDGQIIAVKGVGGFHLVADAANARAMALLRVRKHREEKPFAVMVADVNAARTICDFDAVAEHLLQSPAAPIVLLHKREGAVCEQVAPCNPRLGVMLAYTPLHQLLLAGMNAPVVATSANRGDEPICIDNQEAILRLADLADGFLLHDRPILRRADDSVAQVVAGKMQLLRRSRGFAPLPVARHSHKAALLAVGGHQKNTIALANDGHVFLSPHVGDLDGPEAYDAFLATTAALSKTLKFQPEIVACDLHPDYRSTQFARDCGTKLQSVQHHFAHAMSCIAEHNLRGPVLAVVWDGTGYGIDHTIWGGEFLRIERGQFERVDHLRTFRLPGGEAAIREPRRAAFGLLWELFGEEIPVSLGLSEKQSKLLSTMMRNEINTPRTSAAGRLFDAVAAICGLRHRCSFEGQAAMELEFAAQNQQFAAYPVESTNWEPLVRAIVSDVLSNVALAQIAARFHSALAEMIVRVAKRAREVQIVLSGGCFQNTRLSEQTIAALRRAEFDVYWHQQVPPNDGGIALGQAWAALQE